MSLRAGVASETGAYRDVNQDAAFAAAWGAGVADGVGGGPAGDLASAALLHRLVAGGQRVPNAEALAVRVRGANWDLGAHVRRDPSLAGMATTLTTVWLALDGSLLLAHTGDSRAYRLRVGHLTRQTRDDSYVQALIERGLVRPEDAMTHPQRNIITASLRGGERDLVHVAASVPTVGDRWMICSDGVSDYLPDDAIAEVVAGIAEPQTVAEYVVALALQAGSRDNVTAVIADVVDAAPAMPIGSVTFAGAASARFTEDLTLAG
ncbi:serine/threonine-protein phosphatase [Microbacterium sp.]|uniref:PP2C family protein-serine/threonine phosphatase n=1 Tax=Microbacterium sp. TaxID=51671 RepID=UPI0025E8A8E2|nr:serine/threonine-protein phosphatase [Microbacterium sp.]